MTFSFISIGDFIVKIDREDEYRVSSVDWSLIRRKRDDKPYFRGWVKRPVGTVLLHRFLIDCPKGYQVDHIDGDTLNNSKSNLRLCSISQNCRNTKTHKDNKTGYKGVSWHKRNRKFRAQIQLNSKRRTLGYYSTAKEAALAYNVAAISYYGEFAKLNEVTA